MVRTKNLNKGILCLLVAVALNGIANIGIDAAVLPRNAPLNAKPMVGDSVSAPTPLSVVSTYTLYFGNNGATVSAPVVSQTAAPGSSRSLSSTRTAAAPARSTSKPDKCPSQSRTSSLNSAATASTSINASNSSNASSAAQQNMFFPTAASFRPKTTATAQKVLPNKAEVLPHNFINKVDSLVERYHGITGRKARQVALILSNQTTVVANASRTNTILANLAEAYPVNNATVEGSAANIASMNVTMTVKQAGTTGTAGNKSSAHLPHRYIIQAGRSNLTLFSNIPGYGPDQVRHDLHVIRKWAGDLDQLSTPELLDETVAAIMSASARYFPELSTQAAARVIMADMKAESDFDTTNISGGRLDSGSSWGLLQVSPFGSGELNLFQQHAMVTRNTFSWDAQYNISAKSDHSGAGPLLDWETGKILNLKALSNNDLFRPWVNVHVATWIQSNLARTSSQDPYTWRNIYEKSNAARRFDTDKQGWVALNQALVGAGLPRTCLTALGSWVAGPAVDGYGSYTQRGDDVSAPYFKNIAQGLSVLYGKTVEPSWLNTLALHAGLVDYH